MENTVVFWLFIVAGNLCFIGILLGVWQLAKKGSFKEGKGMLLLILCLFAFFLLFNPLGKEIMLLGRIIVEEELYLAGVGCAVIFLVFMPICQSYLFQMRLTRKREEEYRGYIYNDGLFLFTSGLWWINSLGGLLIAGAINDMIHWDGRLALGILLIVDYIGGVMIAFLQGKEFVMTKKEYYYHSMKRSLEGSLEEIESIECKEKMLVIRIKGEELPLWCMMKSYRDVLLEECEKRIKARGLEPYNG